MVQIKIDTHYRLLNLQTGTYLTRADKDNVAIVGDKYNAENGQEWKFLPAGDNNYFIQAADADQFIAVPLGSVVRAQQLECNIAPFPWKVFAVNQMATVVRFTPMRDCNLNFDLWEANPANGTKIVLHPRTGNNQLWVLEEVRRSMYGEQIQEIVAFTVTEQQSEQQSTVLSENGGVAIMMKSEEDIEVDVKFTEEVTISKKPEVEFGAEINALSIGSDEGNVEEGATELPSVDNDEGNVDPIVA